MKVSYCLIAVFSLVGLWGCEPKPFKTDLGGYSIEFPTTVGEVKKRYPKADTALGYNLLVDSTQSIRVEWIFNPYGNEGNRSAKNHPHGINLFLKNKGNQFDSVKVSLESKFNRTLTLMPMPKLEVNPDSLTPQVYACDLSNDAILVLTKAASDRGDHWSQYNTIRISIGYNLNAKEKELFALRSGNIHIDTY